MIGSHHAEMVSSGSSSGNCTSFPTPTMSTWLTWQTLSEPLLGCCSTAPRPGRHFAASLWASSFLHPPSGSGKNKASSSGIAPPACFWVQQAVSGGKVTDLHDPYSNKKTSGSSCACGKAASLSCEPVCLFRSNWMTLYSDPNVRELPVAENA